MATVRTNHHAAVHLIKCGSPLPDFCTIQLSSKKLYGTSVVIVVTPLWSQRDSPDCGVSGQKPVWL